MKKTYRMRVTLSPMDIVYVEQDALALIDLWNWMVELHSQPTLDGKKFNHRYIVNRLNRTLMLTHPQIPLMHRDLVTQRIKEFIKAIDNKAKGKMRHHRPGDMLQDTKNGMYIRFSEATADLMGKGNTTLHLSNLSPLDVSEIVSDGMIHKHGFQTVILKKTVYGEWHILMTCMFDVEQTILTRVQTANGNIVDVPDELIKLQKAINHNELKALRKKDGSLNQYNVMVKRDRLKRIFNDKINQL